MVSVGVDSDQAIADGLATLLGTYGIEVLPHPDAESFLKYWLPRRCLNCCLDHGSGHALRTMALHCFGNCASGV